MPFCSSFLSQKWEDIKWIILGSLVIYISSWSKYPLNQTINGKIGAKCIANSCFIILREPKNNKCCTNFHVYYQRANYDYVLSTSVCFDHSCVDNIIMVVHIRLLYSETVFRACIYTDKWQHLTLKSLKNVLEKELS